MYDVFVDCAYVGSMCVMCDCLTTAHFSGKHECMLTISSNLSHLDSCFLYSFHHFHLPYNTHPYGRSSKHAKAAKQHLQHMQKVLGQVHESLSTIAGKPNAKRKGEAADAASPPKKKRKGAYKSSNANPELAQREVRAMDQLHQFIQERGGNSEKLLKGFHSRVTKKRNQHNKYDVHFFSPTKQRFRSMLEVGRHFQLVHDESRKAAALKKGHRKQQSTKEQMAEKKRIRRELDKLRKTLQRANKNLDEHVVAHEEDEEEEKENEVAPDASEASVSTTGPTRSRCAATRVCDITGFPNVPPDCIPDVLQAWDFCATFGRVLSLTPMESVDDFSAALAYVPPAATDGDDVRAPPVFVAETHLALLKLLLDDRTSEDWWWSVLETSQEVATATDDSLEKKPVATSNAPVYRIGDVKAMLYFPEDGLVTSSWMQSMKGLAKADKATTKTALRTALRVVANPWVKLYLRKTLGAIVRRGLAFSKQAIAWLVRLYQPLLRAAANDLEAAKAKALEQAQAQLAQLTDKAPAITAKEVAELDLEEEVEEEDEDEEEEDESDEEEEAKAIEAQDKNRLPASPIPPRPLPTLVDFLLPPNKPKSSDDFINAFTWSELVGATVHRILHSKKRILNEVDDAMRQDRELDPLTVPERRERESVAVRRILTECAIITDEQIEKAIFHLCEGKPYLELSFVERLCILRLLIEAAYDTDRLHEVVARNYNDRASAMKSLEVEQRKAKKEAKEKAAADEAAARQKLATDAKEAFLDEKRDEIRKLNENSHELTDDVIDALTDEEIIEFDDDYKADYEALPTPDSFNKVQVAEMVARMHEEAAFETDALRILTLDGVLERDRLQLEEMEAQLQELLGDQANVDRETQRAIDRLMRDIEKTKNNAERLPEMREKAMEGLRDAIADGTMKVLRAAMTAAKRAKLTGPDDETGGVWAVDLLRDAALELEKAKQNKKVFDAQRDLVAKRNKCFIRTEPLGYDRFGNRFWAFDHGEDGHVWVDAEYVLADENHENDEHKSAPGFLDMVKTPDDIMVGTEDMEEDFVDESTDLEVFERFSRQVYHSTGFSSSLVKNHWGCHATEESLRGVIKHLDSKNPREGELKLQLKETVENKAGAGDKVELTNDAKPEPEDGEEKNEEDGEAEAANVTEAIPDDKTDGDEEWFERVKTKNQNNENARFEGLQDLKSAIRRKVRVRDVVSQTKDAVLAKYETGTVLAWKIVQEERRIESESSDDEDEDEMDFEPQIEKVDVAQWKIVTNRGHQYWLTGELLLESMARYEKQQSGSAYYEHDAVFLGYRNALGKFCGKASDAPLSSSPIYFARTMIRRENELYPKLKIRSYDNSWGGKSGQRALWTNSMKDFAFDLATVRQGLLTLENAFFDLTLEWSEYENIVEGEEPDAKQILADPATRNEIELESIESNIPGLWRNPATRAVFIEIVSNAQTTGVLALALDLLCRNTMKYLQKHKLHNVRTQSYTDDILPPRASRRRNAWQESKYDESKYDDWF